MPRRYLLSVLFFALAVILVPDQQVVLAQKKAPEVIAPPPQAPTLTAPAGIAAKVGQTTELILTGTNLSEPTAVFVGAPLKATIAKAAKGDDATRVRVSIAVPKDASIGLYPIRVATKAGISNVRPLVVDDLPEVKDAADNTTKDLAQPLTVPCAVTGKIDVESADFFKVPVKAGQTLTFEVLGRRLGSPLDPLIVLHDAKTKRELISLYADDTPGLQSDARLTHHFKEPGEILIEVRDTTYRGGAAYTYRLRVGEFPGATTAYPLAVQRGQAASIGFSGLGGDLIPPVKLTAPRDPGLTAMYVAPRLPQGVSGWPVPVRLSDDPETVEKEPNNDAAKANPISVPGGISARFGTPNDLDYFKFPAKKGDKLALTALAYEINAPTEVLLRVVDEKGKELAKSNPTQPAVKAEFTAPADGTYFAVCEHLNYLSGPNEVYHLSIRPVTADFELTLPVDNFEVSATTGTAVLATNITRLNGFNGPIELRIAGDPAFSGRVILPADATTGYVPLKVKPGTPPGAYAIRVEGMAKVGDKEITRSATTLELVKTAFAALTNPPLEFVGQAAVGVTEKPPFALIVTADPANVEKGKPATLVIEARRNGYDGEITIAAPTIPNVTVTAKPIAKGATKGEATATVAAAGAIPIVLKATAKVGGKDYVVLTEPLTLTITDTKAAEPKKDTPKPKAKK